MSFLFFKRFKTCTLQTGTSIGSSVYCSTLAQTGTADTIIAKITILGLCNDCKLQCFFLFFKPFSLYCFRFNPQSHSKPRYQFHPNTYHSAFTDRINRPVNHCRKLDGINIFHPLPNDCPALNPTFYMLPTYLAC